MSLSFKNKVRFTVWGLLFLCTIFVLATLELDLRREHSELIAGYGKKGTGLCIQADNDPDLMYSFKPNKCGANSKGYFDAEHSVKKEQGVFRIVIIGDSIAQGQGVKLKESFGKILETKLNSAQKEKKYEVIILARSGYSTSQELVLLGKEAFQYAPDLILWSYCLNDPAHPVYHDANGGIGNLFYKPASYLFESWARKWFFFKENNRRKRCCQNEFHEFLHCVYWDEVVENLSRIGKITRAHHVPVIFLIHPVFEKGKSFSSYSLTDLHHKLAAAAENQNLLTLDLLYPYSKYDPEELRQHPKGQYDPWHPNEKGHRVAAEFLYNYVFNSKFFKERS